MSKNKRYTIHFAPGDVWIDFYDEKITVRELKEILSSVPDDFYVYGAGRWLGTLSFGKDK